MFCVATACPLPNLFLPYLSHLDQVLAEGLRNRFGFRVDLKLLVDVLEVKRDSAFIRNTRFLKYC